jgi:hypothetical protein
MTGSILIPPYKNDPIFTDITLVFIDNIPRIIIPFFFQKVNCKSGSRLKKNWAWAILKRNRNTGDGGDFPPFRGNFTGPSQKDGILTKNDPFGGT